jgi:hypothetical protein
MTVPPKKKSFEYLGFLLVLSQDGGKQRGLWISGSRVSQADTVVGSHQKLCRVPSRRILVETGPVDSHAFDRYLPWPPS